MVVIVVLDINLPHTFRSALRSSSNLDFYVNVMVEV